MPYGHASMLLLGKGSEATEPYNKYDQIRPHSIRSLQFDQKIRPLSFRPEKFDLFTATPCWLANKESLRSLERMQEKALNWINGRAINVLYHYMVSSKNDISGQVVVECS